jgi:hypothetical protein
VRLAVGDGLGSGDAAWMGRFGGQGAAVGFGFAATGQLALQRDEVLSRRDPHLTGGSHLQHTQQARLALMASPPLRCKSPCSNSSLAS